MGEAEQDRDSEGEEKRWKVDRQYIDEEQLIHDLLRSSLLPRKKSDFTRYFRIPPDCGQAQHWMILSTMTIRDSFIRDGVARVGALIVSPTLVRLGALLD